jgi:hypothetical protein
MEKEWIDIGSQQTYAAFVLKYYFGVILACIEFHKHFMSSFSANFLMPIIRQMQDVSGRKLHVGEIDTWPTKYLFFFYVYVSR